MASTCINCGIKISFFDSYRRLIPTQNEVFCENCYYKFEAIRSNVENLVRCNSYEDVYVKYEDELIELGLSENSLNCFKNFCEYSYNHRVEKTKEEIDKEFEKELDEKAISKHILTTGYNFEGYKIEKYCGVISGEVVLGTGFLSELAASFSDFFGEESEQFALKMEAAKDSATKKLIRKSLIKGGNAVIGLDFDYVNFANNMIGVSANGTSVKIFEV